MTVAGLVLLSLAAALWLVIAIQAFGASVGQGLACLCAPFYAVYYGFARFEHRRKRLILTAWVLAAIFGAGLVQCGTAFSIRKEIRDQAGPAATR
jgi:hypothetical protein